MCLLLITSSISMQLFCFIKNLKQFETFPRVSQQNLLLLLFSYFDIR